MFKIDLHRHNWYIARFDTSHHCLCFETALYLRKVFIFKRWSNVIEIDPKLVVRASEILSHHGLVRWKFDPAGVMNDFWLRWKPDKQKTM